MIPYIRLIGYFVSDALSQSLFQAVLSLLKKGYWTAFDCTETDGCGLGFDWAESGWEKRGGPII
jgi:hypothetical protein